MAASEPEGLTLQVRVQPKASRNAWQREADGSFRIYLTAPPVEGAANKALLEFLAKEFGIAKRSVTLSQGEKSRAKVVRISGVSQDDLERVLNKKS